jgi:L,D-peptidoglycan transpeptidase YkuD (ErfK/YbiS/YcfS/YnhG family)
VVQQHGKLGRSEGCFAVSQTDLDQVLNRLGKGHLIYADKV